MLFDWRDLVVRWTVEIRENFNEFNLLIVIVTESQTYISNKSQRSCNSVIAPYNCLWIYYYLSIETKYDRDGRSKRSIQSAEEFFAEKIKKSGN